jgi:hypothetical protein
VHGHLVTLSGAPMGRGLSDRERDGERQILMDGELGIGGAGSSAGEYQRNSSEQSCSSNHENSSLINSAIAGGG